VLDWEATLAFHPHLWGLGLKIVKATDTAQRGMGMDWPVARELIARALAEARATHRCSRRPAAIQAAFTLESLPDVPRYQPLIPHFTVKGGARLTRRRA